MARASGPTWSGFVLWALVGAVFAIGFLTLSILFVVPVVIGVVVFAIRPTRAKSGFGLVTGAGLVSIYVAFVQRRGPGTVCWSTATESGCDEFLNPWPWLVIGVALVCVGVLGHISGMRRERVVARSGSRTGIDRLGR
jgi:hypothetical protein